MKKLISLFLCTLLLSGCAATYDGPTREKPMLTEYVVTHCHAFFDWEEVQYTDRTVYAYDVYGNLVRSMEYRDDALETVSNMKYDDRGNQISRTTWDHSGWLPKFSGRTKRTYDDQDRVLSYESYNLWGRVESGSYYTYDDEARTQTWSNGLEDSQISWYDENGNVLRQVSGEYETVYEYDDQGNRIGWSSYKNGQPYDRYEARYDDRGRQIHGARYDADGNLASQTEYVYDDEANTMTYLKSGGGKRIEHYHPDGRPHMIEDYTAEGKLSMLQQYYYRDILVPAEQGETP